MDFGRRIKKLRLDAGMTQERLAELLSISPQAVSRWETDCAMPDISLLPPLANLFSTTTDFLLGMETYEKDLRKAEFDSAFHEYWKHDDKEKNYQTALKAATEYPGNMDYVEWLASSEYYIAFKRDEDEYEKLLKSSAEHYRIVIENTVDKGLKHRAIQGIVLALSAVGRKKEAREYAERADDSEKRDELLCWCLDGEERLSHTQSVCERFLNRFLFYFDFGVCSFEHINATEKILKALFPDGNYHYYHERLCFNCMYKACVYSDEGEYDKAIESLEKAKYHSLALDESVNNKTYRFTSPFFSLVEGEWPEVEAETNFDGFITRLNNNDKFDSLREREDFKALYMR